MVQDAGTAAFSQPHANELSSGSLSPADNSNLGQAHLERGHPSADDLLLLPAPVHKPNPCAPGDGLGVVHPEAEGSVLHTCLSVVNDREIAQI